MTEADWLTATDPRPMLEFLRGKASDRKLRLFAVACCRAVWSRLADPWSRKGVEVSEGFADGQASNDNFRRGVWKAEGAFYELQQRGEQQRLKQRVIAVAGLDPDEEFTDPPHELFQAIDAARAAYMTGYSSEVFLSCTSTELLRPDFVRDISGNPFQPVAFDPTWRSETVVALAVGIYADRAFDRLPILADALEEAGCDQPDILNHCRGPGPHVRGCWAVDLVLGKE